MTPTKLPLPETMSRCLGHGSLKTDWCARLETCATHQTIAQDYKIDVQIENRKCWTDNWVGYIPMDGSLADIKNEP